MTTPNNITELKDNQIIVFGSNLNGQHAGGLALECAKKWNAQEGVGEGLTGQCYAFPTLDKKMKKVTKKALKQSKELLYKVAEKNQDTQFLVTKVGCGIAGFTKDEMKKIFQGDKPSNVILPAGWAVIKGFKAFNKGLKCRDFQYKLGKDFYFEGQIMPCLSGFHFCKNLGDVYDYYQFGDDIIVGEVESEGEVIDEENKSVTNHIKITRLLGTAEASNNNGVNNVGHSNTGDSNTGHSNTGDSNTGDSNTGDSNTGDSNTGDWNTGHSNTGDWNTSDYNTGFFNTEEIKEILIFNKPCLKLKWDKAKKPSCLFFGTKQWVYFEDMTDEEKKENESAKTFGGYLKTIPYKEAFTKSMQNASTEDIKLLKKLPNFDADVFEEISGFRVN